MTMVQSEMELKSLEYSRLKIVNDSNSRIPTFRNLHANEIRDFFLHITEVHTCLYSKHRGITTHASLFVSESDFYSTLFVYPGFYM